MTEQAKVNEECEELIYLRVVRDGDKLKLLDQHGRRLAYTMSVSLNSEVGQAATYTVTARDCKGENEKYYLDCE